jgi:hypothetical protein
MRIIGTIIGVLLVFLGGLWILQGSNVVGGSVMSGQSQWLMIGIVALLAGIIAIWWFQFRRR